MNQHEDTHQDMAGVLQEGVRLDALEGAAVAWAYLLRHSVEPATILRILSGANAAPRVAAAVPETGGLGVKDA